MEIQRRAIECSRHTLEENTRQEVKLLEEWRLLELVTVEGAANVVEALSELEKLLILLIFIHELLPAATACLIFSHD